MKSMVTYFEISKGGSRVKRFGLVLSLVLIFTLIGASAVLAAPGVYPPYAVGSNPPTYDTQIDETSGVQDTTLWGWENTTDPNANQTGVDPVTEDDGVAGTTANFDAAVKNVSTQRVHGEYQNDTNSCASCHQTHTAAGNQLLFKNGIYNTCSACHDGTLGFYNVFATGKAPVDGDANAGTFGSADPINMGASVHLANGSVKVSAAPGGDRDSTDAKSWGKVFTCASCHAPHGSYSDRLLHYNPNMIAMRLTTEGGTKIAGVSATDANLDGVYDTLESKAVNAAKAPWVFGYDMTTTRFYTEIKVGGNWQVASGVYAGQPYNKVLRVNYQEGLISDPYNVINGGIVTVDVAPAIVVKVAKNFTTGLDPAPANTGIKTYRVDHYISGINEYCSGCHWDYATGRVGLDETPSGYFSNAFRHTMKEVPAVEGLQYEEDTEYAAATGGKEMVCLSCHYAHGTDLSTMKQANDTDAVAKDVNKSSALKRYVNMAVCWKCHTNLISEQLVNNDSYWNQVEAGTAPVNGVSNLPVPVPTP